MSPALIANAVMRTARTWGSWLWSLRPRAAKAALRPVLMPMPVELPDEPEIIGAPEIVSEPEPVVDKPSPWRRGINAIRRVEEADSTRWHLRGQILDRLDEYFFCIRQVRKLDASSYSLFSKIGFAVPADVFAHHEAPRFATIPSSGTAFGGCLWPNSSDYDDGGWVNPSFVYFEKLKRVSRVQRFTDGPVYRLTCLYDNRKRKDRWRTTLAAVNECYIGIHAVTGAMTVLREAVMTTHKIQTGTRNRRRRREILTVSTEAWALPAWLASVCADHPGETPESWPCNVLRDVFHTYASATEKIVIRVKHEGACASFGLDVARAKYFFKDRSDTALAVDGRRKRIFHAVRQHERHLVTGVTEVRFHYRGLRTFDWNGYGVHIVWPTTTNVLHFDKPGMETNDIPEEQLPLMADESRVGEMFAEVLER